MNTILQRLGQSAPANPAAAQTSNPVQMLQQFSKFKQLMRGRDPQALVNQLVAQGRMTPAQLEQLKQQAMSLRDFLK